MSTTQSPTTTDSSASGPGGNPAEPGPSLQGRVALITGAGKRIGAEIARRLHGAGADIAIHYRTSATAAEALKSDLEAERPGSVLLAPADLNDAATLPALIEAVTDTFGRLDVLVHNASSFYPTPVARISEQDWDALMGSNLKGPFFLTLAAAAQLRANRGCVVNLVDIHAERPLADHAVYSIAKAGNAMMVKTLARELGPGVRVNGVAPGAILWPAQGLADATKDEILSRTALKRPGSPADIARTVLFLVRDADYITGQIIAVDGGRTVQQ
jgi:pteridine reductase